MGETVGIKEHSKISVIVPARNESATIAQVVREARKIADNTEVIVVCNGTTDQTADRAREAGAKVVMVGQPLGYDVGRAIGAACAQGEILLFIDGDFVIPANILRQYTTLIKQGNDLVLNAYSGLQKGTRIHSTSVAKRFLNRAMGCPELKGSSMTTVPHAMNRKALQAIGIQNLAVPPKAQVQAILSGLKIERGVEVNTALVNQKRKGRKESVADLVVGDHLEALAYAIDHLGIRADLTDHSRRRELLHLENKNHLRRQYRYEEKAPWSVGGD